MLYHYCTPQTFNGIMSNKEVWMSSLLNSNDFMEGAVFRAWLESHLSKAGLDDLEQLKARQLIDEYCKAQDFLGLCMTEKDDHLGQWRGYAADGTGFSVGFDDGILRTSIKEKYNQNAIQSRVAYSYDKIAFSSENIVSDLKHRAETGVFGRAPRADMYADDEGKAEAKRQFFRFLDAHLPSWFGLKPEGFSEEQEVRLLQQVPTTYEDCKFRLTADGKIIPYRAVPLHKNAIVRVVMGPKNKNDKGTIEAMLDELGFVDVEVDRSKLSYR